MFSLLFTDGKCEDRYDCESLKPDCTFPVPKENCQKYCGLCEGKYWEDLKVHMTYSNIH